MSVQCKRATSGGKGNRGMFIERSPNIYAAGFPTPQPDNRVSDHLQHYLLQEEVDALIGDAIIPPDIPKPPPPLRRPRSPDMRNAGIGGQVANIINPPAKSKFETLVEDFKDTTFSSYWKKSVGKGPDQVPMLPEGLDVYNTTFGKKTPVDPLYDLVFPKVPVDKTPVAENLIGKLDRKYCKPEFDADYTYGHRSHTDKRGVHVKRCLTDDRISASKSNRTILTTNLTSYQDSFKSRLGKGLAPNNNISYVPKGYAFGILSKPDNVKECLSFCEINPEGEFYRKCLAHLNNVRKCLSYRFVHKFFNELFLALKYFDTEKSGWLPRDIVYNYCATKLIRFDSSLIEPLLAKWNAFDGSNIDYEFFLHVINYREPIRNIPHVADLPPECLEYRTTYNEMMEPVYERDTSRKAGAPSGRYFDLDYPVLSGYYCRADKISLPQESDVKSCLSPNIFSILNVNHRDMYAKRERDVVKKVFKAAGENFSDEEFNEIWEEAKKYHSQGWVCYETFRQALRKFSDVGK